MMIAWEGLSTIGDSRALLPLAAVLVVLLPATHRRVLLRWLVAVAVVAAVTLASKIAFMGWGWGIESLDFTGLSGHAAMSSTVYPVTFWLLACGRSRRPWAWALAGALLAAAIAGSRLPLRAHSLSEILLGLSLGLAASAWTLHGLKSLGSILAVRAYAALLAVCAAVATPALLADIHTHDLVKATAKALSGRDRALDRDDLHKSSLPTRYLE